MKEKITLMPSPMSFFTRWPISTRVLTTVLNRCNKFDVHFFDILTCYVRSISEFKNIDIPNDSAHAILTNNSVGGATSNFSRFPHFYVGAGMLDDYILESIKTDVVFYSAPFAQDFRIIKTLLESGKKVLLGGTVTLIYGIKSIRESMLDLTPEQQKNLCIVEGYVDLNTDLYSIYKKWEDFKITENDLTTIWDCREDFTLERKSIYKRIFSTNLGILLNTKCWWGKCRYCTFPCVPIKDFTEGMSSKEVVKKIIELGELYDSKNIYFFDSYMRDTDRNKEILYPLKDNGFKLSIYTGMHLFNGSKAKKYIDFINDCYIDPFIGLEHTNTNTLKAINKGYNFEQVEIAFDNMFKYMSKDVRPVMCVMADLPIVADSKKEAIDIIRKNYDYIKNKKDLFSEAGFCHGIGFQPDLKALRHLPKNTLVTKDGLIREAKPNEFNSKDLIGMWALYYHMAEKSGISLDKFDKVTNKPLVRYLPSGEKLESDLYFVDKEIIREFSTWIQWKGFYLKNVL